MFDNGHAPRLTNQLVSRAAAHVGNVRVVLREAENPAKWKLPVTASFHDSFLNTSCPQQSLLPTQNHPLQLVNEVTVLVISSPPMSNVVGHDSCTLHAQ